MAANASTEPAPLKLPSAELSAFFADLSALFAGKESEEDWDERDKMLQKLRQIARAPGMPRDATFLEGLKVAVDVLNRTVGQRQLE
jgi:hypothetical protein